MRIAVVANTAWYLVNFRLSLMRELYRCGHEVVAVAPADAEHDAPLRTAGLIFEAVPISGSGTHPLRELRSVLRLRTLMQRQGIDLVLSYTPKGNLYSALAAISCGLPFMPNVSGLGRAFIRRSFITLVVKMLYRLTFRRARHVFFQNMDDLDAFVRSGLADHTRCERLPGSGVDLRRFQPIALPVRHEHAPVFLMVARLMWDKGVGEFIEAARQLRAEYPNACFRLLGPVDVDNPSAVPRSRVDSWVAEGLIDYLGATNDVRPFIADADCVVLPSYREGVPRSLLEAAAMARPVVTTDAPGCRDTVIDGESGFLCRPADAGDLADRMRRFIALPLAQRLAFGSRGRDLAESVFDEQVVMRRYLAAVAALEKDETLYRS